MGTGPSFFPSPAGAGLRLLDGMIYGIILYLFRYIKEGKIMAQSRQQHSLLDTTPRSSFCRGGFQMES